MKKTQATVLISPNGSFRETPIPYTIPGYDPNVEGLTVHRAPMYEDGIVSANPKGTWSVSHHSGYLVAHSFPKMVDAMEFAREAGKMAHWEGTHREVYRDVSKVPGFGRVLWRLAVKCGGKR